VLLPALVLSGCFDVRQANQVVVLDDFDNIHSDFYPVDTDFDPWQCVSFGQAGNNYSCDHAPGANGSLYSLMLQATVVDPNDGAQQSGGALLQTRTPFILDFTSVTEIDFDAKLAFAFDQTDQASLNLEIGCTTAPADDGSVANDLFVQIPIPYQPGWTHFTELTADLTDPPANWPNTKKVKGGPAACLKVADSVRFSVDTALADGETGSFVLFVDTIELR
jgi:hypothetical protein